MKGASWLHNGHDAPSPQMIAAVRSGEWTEGGMAEAGWFLSGTTRDGAPIFTRSQNMRVNFA